jgi:putative flippase GtrA
MKRSVSTAANGTDRRPGLPPVVRFVMVGALNTLFDYGVFALLAAAGLPALPAHVISYSSALVTSFLMHKRFTFGAGRFFSWVEAVKFLVVNLAALSAAGGMLLFGTDVLRLPELAAKALALPVSAGINYLGNRLWVFPRRGGRGLGKSDAV